MDPISDLIARYSALEVCKDDLVLAYKLIARVFENKKNLFICGNGGSASDADHIVGELVKGFENPRPLDPKLSKKLKDKDPHLGKVLIDGLQQGLPAIALYGNHAIATAVSNDNQAQLIYAQQLQAIGKPGDVLLAISTSGNSPNILYALYLAQQLGIHTIGLTGKSGGKMKKYCEVCIYAPSSRTLQIQEYHLPLYHTICLMLENHFFGEDLSPY